MKRYLLGFGLTATLLLCYSSSESKDRIEKANILQIKQGRNTTKAISKQQEKLTSFIPKGFVLFEKIKGDLNKDGYLDEVLIVKGTDKSKIIVNRFDERVDRNRRGIIILLNKKGRYELTLKNLDCFSSENEEGGVYFPPELSIQIEKGNLYFHYGHGRYGYWRYTFRFRNADFELIGYDASDNFGPRIERETSINFLTSKKLVKENTNQNAEGGDEVFKEKWFKIPSKPLIKLSQIKDFDDLISGE